MSTQDQQQDLDQGKVTLEEVYRSNLQACNNKCWCRRCCFHCQLCFLQKGLGVRYYVHRRRSKPVSENQRCVRAIGCCLPLLMLNRTLCGRKPITNPQTKKKEKKQRKKTYTST
uniref:Protein Tat n=1 Tax=Simian immunodeficiency virus TaxID=11723 RepID=F4N9Q0_SIV|nr:Tat protein [Simian immunodeficiency virus]